MKKYLFIAIFLAGISISCSKSELPVNEKIDILNYTGSELRSPNSIEDYIDSMGILHNEYLSTIESHLANGEILPYSEDFYESLNNYSQLFFTNIGITNSISFSEDEIILWEAESFIPTEAYNELNIEAIELLENLELRIDSLSNHNYFIYQCDSLLLESNLLTSDEERLIVGGAINVAKYSAEYWNDYTSIWLSYFSTAFNAPVNTKKLVKQDARGAIYGGRLSLGGGLAGIFAGGLVGAGVRSAGYLVGVGFNWW